MQSNPNPQGKGLVPILDQLSDSVGMVVEAKKQDNILTNYLISTLVLSAPFNFKPVQGNSYSLYWRDQRWRLSPIAPEQWSSDIFGFFIGSCHLKTDFTWQIEPAENLTTNALVIEALERFVLGFSDNLTTTQSLESGLPYCQRSLPFYPRIMAHAMAKSLATSMSASSLLCRPGQDWLSSTAKTQFELELLQPTPAV